MKRGLIWQRLRRPSNKLMLGGAGLIALFSPLACAGISILLRDPVDGIVILAAGSGWFLGWAMLFRGLWLRLRLRHHPDFQALARHGPPFSVAAAVEGELAAGRDVAHRGDGLATPESCLQGEILLTPSWLVFVCSWWEDQNYLDRFRFSTRGRVFVVRLQDLVRAYRARLDALALSGQDAAWGAVVLVERTGQQLIIPGDETGTVWLMAEIIARVPWALTRFDAETEQKWRDAREEIIAEVDRNRIRLFRTRM